MITSNWFGATARKASFGRIFKSALGAVAACSLLLGNCLAEDLTTRDGKKYENVREIEPSRDGIVFSYGPDGGFARAKVLFKNLSDDLQRKYGYVYDPFEDGLLAARQNRPISLTLNSAFRLSSLDAAKKKAHDEKKLLGFIMVWDVMFEPGSPMGVGAPNDLAGFYTVFNDALVLVFVRHEDELNKVPDAVKKGFFGPDEGGFAPNMAVVTADCSQYVCEVPLGGGKSNGQVREPVFRAKIAEIKKFLQHPEASALETAAPIAAKSEAVHQENVATDKETVVPGQWLEGIRKIPRATRLLYGAIAAFVLLTFLLRRRQAD